MAILKELGDDLLACNQSKVLADDRKNIAQCIKKIEPKTPIATQPATAKHAGKG